VPRQKSWPAASLSGSPNSSTEGLSLSSRTHTIVDPSAPALPQRKTSVTTAMKNTDLGHSAWGSRLIHRLTLLRQRLRHQPIQEHRLCPAETEITTASCMLTWDI
jgi:hypothetical protein